MLYVRTYVGWLVGWLVENALYIFVGTGPDQHTAAVLHNQGFIHLAFTPSLESLCKQALEENAVYGQGIQMYEDVDVIFYLKPPPPSSEVTQINTRGT